MDDDSLAPPAYDSPEIWGQNYPQPKSSSTSYPTEKPKLEPTSQQLASSPFAASSSSDSSLLRTQRSGTHTLHIYRIGAIFNYDLTILDSDKVTNLYNVYVKTSTAFSSPPHMRVHRCSSDSHYPNEIAPIGTATFSSFSRTIDLTLQHRAVSLSPKGIFGWAHEFQSGIGPLSWKSNGWGLDLILMTKAGEWIAKFESAPFSVDKRGRMEIVNWDIQGEALDEIVTSGVAMMEYMRRRKQ